MPELLRLALALIVLLALRAGYYALRDLWLEYRAEKERQAWMALHEERDWADGGS